MDHAHELRRHARKIGHPAGDVPAVMLASADEIERLRSALENMEVQAVREVIPGWVSIPVVEWDSIMTPKQPASPG